MGTRVPWDQYEVALLFRAYGNIVDGADINTEAKDLSQQLRKIALHRGTVIDETYRNVNGMKMQLGNVQYLFTNGAKGLSGASEKIRNMYQLYQNNQGEYRQRLKEA